MNLLALAVFATIDETAIDALKRAAATCDPQYECGGVVRKVDRGFTASTVITSTKPFGVDLGQLYGADVVADFHTHICSIHNKPFADFFSPADAMVNQGLHTVGYMLSLCDRNIRRYDPSQDDRDDEEVDFHSGRVIYLTSGHIVGWAPLVSAEEQLAADLTDEPALGQSAATLRPVALHGRRHLARSSSRHPVSLTLSTTTYSAGVEPAPESHARNHRK
jgi:hypothetical protein